MRKRLEMKAVYDRDLEQILLNLDILDDLIAGNLSCSICERQVDFDNLGAIFAKDDEIKVCCDDEKCIRRISTQRMLTSDE